MKFSVLRKWIEVIYKEVESLTIHREIFWQVQAIIKNNPKIQKGNSFYSYLGSTYSSSIVMGIRRQVKIEEQSISLARLLDEIHKAPEDISKKQFVRLYGRNEYMRKIGEQDFDRYYGFGQEYIDSKTVKMDLDKLKFKLKKCERYADKIVAHIDKKKPKTLPTFKDVDLCIELLERLVLKYYTLFTGKAVNSMLPTWQYDWKEIFRTPWIT